MLNHEFDEDSVCSRCGFDGAEWVWWRNHTYEGRAVQTPMPECKPMGRDCMDTAFLTAGALT